MSSISPPATPRGRGVRAPRLGLNRGQLGAGLLILIAVALGLLPYVGSDYDVIVGYQVLQLAALAQAWNLLAGYGGLVSLASAAFIGLGGYTTAELAIHTGLPLVLALLASGALAAGFAILVSVPMFRFRGLYFTIGTLVLAELLAQFMLNYNGFGGNAGLTILRVNLDDSPLYWYALALAIVATVVLVVVRRLRLGSAMLAIRDDEEVAREVGVPTFAAKLWVFALSAFIMGLVGGLQAVKLGNIEPSGAFSLQWTIDIVNATIIGGIGTVVGPLVGALFIIEFGVQLANYPELHIALTGLLLILVIRFAPRGIWGTLTGWVNRRLGAGGPDLEIPDPGAYRGREPLAQAASGPLLATSGLGKSFGGVHAVTDVSFELQSQEVLGIIGPNGAGKSTLIGLLSGAHTASSGQITIAGTPAQSLAPEARARLGIGRTHQVPRPFGTMTVLENLEVACRHGGGIRGRREARRQAASILALTGLAEFASSPAEDLGLLRLKRLELARALALAPRILLLDEIGAGLVETEVHELIELIQRLRHEVEAIIVVEHVLDVIHACCDRVVVLDGGAKLVEGDVASVMADEQVVAVYLGTGATVEDHERAPHPGRRAASRPLLRAAGISAGYGHARALSDVSLEIGEGEVVALLGANGAGKTTTARVLSGMLPALSGAIEVDGRPLTGHGAHDFVSAGIAHCMEGRRIFGDLSVEENLLIGGRAASREEQRRRVREVYALFGALEEKRGQPGKQLSGGQQQQLALGRAMMAAPRLMLLDEISLGLAPVVIERMYEALAEINGRGVAMLVVEQNVARGLQLADHVYVLEKGRVALDGTPGEIRRDPRLRALYVGEAKGTVGEVKGAETR